MRTQIVIIGGGPSGMLLSVLLNRMGVNNIVLERKTGAYVISRIRAGIIEESSVGVLEKVGVAGRLMSNGIAHTGCEIASQTQHFRVDFARSRRSGVRVYGQTEVTKDLYAAHCALDGAIFENVENVQIDGVKMDSPRVRFSIGGIEKTIQCDYVVGCDGFHGVSRKTIPRSVRKEYEKTYPFGWLGLLSETPPVSAELIYAQSERGFALASMRNQNLSRYYLQVPLQDKVEQWSDGQFWDELKKRMPEQVATELVTGPSIEKSIAPLRSFVSEPMSWGRLFLCGDAAHIVPPTGAKGLNLAISDVHYLSAAFALSYLHNDDSGLSEYSDRALERVWQAIRFSWWMTKLLHAFPSAGNYERRIQQAEIDHLARSIDAQKDMAQNYVGAPL